MYGRQITRSLAGCTVAQDEPSWGIWSVPEPGAAAGTPCQRHRSCRLRDAAAGVKHDLAPNLRNFESAAQGITTRLLDEGGTTIRLAPE